MDSFFKICVHLPFSGPERKYDDANEPAQKAKQRTDATHNFYKNSKYKS
ncbi:hypothetical protein LAU_0378 [Lausannevirus]|uniref:Uncharacterized protein n=1 Tax=Lausannevirus TaxID=999883 RepID=F2WLV5_9VIRU|nr:hypothetical protein LAU_0378 [Lausannevirus]AEA07228.1 hypothetical protein LAU_0378 [Lausannevirus]